MGGLLPLKELSHRTVWDLLTEGPPERADKTEKTKQLQATLALLKLAQLFEAAHMREFAIVNG